MPRRAPATSGPRAEKVVWIAVKVPSVVPTRPWGARLAVSGLSTGAYIVSPTAKMPNVVTKSAEAISGASWAAESTTHERVQTPPTTMSRLAALRRAVTRTTTTCSATVTMAVQRSARTAKMRRKASIVPVGVSASPAARSGATSLGAPMPATWMSTAEIAKPTPAAVRPSPKTNMPTRKAGADCAQTRPPTPTAASSLATTATVTGLKRSLSRPAKGAATRAPTEKSVLARAAVRAPQPRVLAAYAYWYGSTVPHPSMPMDDARMSSLVRMGFTPFPGWGGGLRESTQLRYRIFRHRSSISKD